MNEWPPTGYEQAMGRWLAGLGLAAALSAARPAHADAPLRLEVTGQDASRVRTAVERELAGVAPAPRGALTIERTRARSATITFVAEDGRRLVRTLALQSDPAGSAEEIALVAASLTRDEPEVLPELEDPPPSAIDTPGTPRTAAKTDVGKKAATSSRAAAAPIFGAAVFTPPPAPPRIGPCARDDLEIVPLGLDFAPFVGTSTFGPVRDASRAFALNLLGSVGAGVNGAEIGFFNVDTELACGVQIASIGNVVGGDVDGFQMAAVLDVVSGHVRGLQMASVVNVVGDGFTGVQLAAVTNVVTGRFAGLQQSNVLNVVAGELDGVQLGTVNVVSGRVRGVQVGVVNVAEKSDLSIGVVSINARGRWHLDLWSEVEAGILSFAVKHGGDHWHGFWGVSTRLTDASLGVVLGVGGHLPVTDRVYLDLDVLFTEYASFAGERRGSELFQARPVVGVKLVDELAIYGGATFNWMLSRSPGSDWSPGYAFDLGSDSGPASHLWPGALVGVQGLGE